MLSNGKIERALRNKEIEISVSFGYNEDRNPVRYQTEKNLLSSSLKGNLYSDRLKLTMGPIIKVLNKKPISSKYRFKSSLNYHDLRKSNNKYIINPGESIILLTNEKIKLNGKYACLIIPRISMSDVGIVVTTAYADPYCNGIMRLHLTNMSEKPYELNFLEAIAQCFFFELSDPVSETFKEQFPMKSVFFGHTWNEILNSDRNAFPTKKESTQIDRLANLKYQLNIGWSFVKKHSLIFLFLTNLIALLCGFVVFQQDFANYTMAVEQIESILNPIASEIVIDSGKLYGEKEIIVKYAKSDIISVLCNSDEINYKILSGDVENETRIVFSVYLPSEVVDDYEIDFTYVIIRRIDK